MNHIVHKLDFHKSLLFLEGPFDDLFPWNYSEVNRMIPGVKTARVTTEQELIDELKKAYQSNDGPRLLELVVDRMDLPAPQQRALEAARK